MPLGFIVAKASRAVRATIRGCVRRLFIPASDGWASSQSRTATLAAAEDVLKAMYFEEMFAKIMDRLKKAMEPMMQ